VSRKFERLAWIRLLFHIVQQRFGVFQGRGIEAFGKLVVDFDEHRAGFVAAPGLLGGQPARPIVARNSHDLGSALGRLTL
jgi:hypothetical protein